MTPTSRHIAIVGSGPAGGAAAQSLLAAGWRVSVFDEQPRPGGNVGRMRRDAPESALEHASEGITLRLGTRVLQVDGDGEVEYNGQSGVEQQRFDGIILACGAYDLHTPVSDTPSPNVHTAGGLQALMKGQGLVPAGEVVVAGAGPFLYVAAAGLLRAGARITALVDRLDFSSYARLAPAGIGIPGNALEFTRERATLLRHRVPVITGRRVTAVSETTLTLDNERELTFDRLALTDSFVAQSQLPRSAGCALRWHAPGGYFITETDDWGRSSVPGVLVCGEGQGVRGWRHAKVSGELAALALLADNGQPMPPARERRLHRLRVRYTRFGEALERLLADGAPAPKPQTVVCACESVTTAAVDEAVALGLADLSSIKVVTRCGMGPCQGRYCEPHVGRRIEFGGHAPRDALSHNGLARPVNAAHFADTRQWPRHES